MVFGCTKTAKEIISICPNALKDTQRFFYIENVLLDGRIGDRKQAMLCKIPRTYTVMIKLGDRVTKMKISEATDNVPISSSAQKISHVPSCCTHCIPISDRDDPSLLQWR